MQIGGFTLNLIKISQEMSLLVQLYCISIHFQLSIIWSLKILLVVCNPCLKWSRNIIKDDIMKIYKVEKGKMSSYLEKFETIIAITTYMWTSNQKKDYMAITVITLMRLGCCTIVL